MKGGDSRLTKRMVSAGSVGSSAAGHLPSSTAASRKAITSPSAARAEAALVCFGGAGATLRFGPAVPRWWNERWLRPVGGGGGTPLASGVREAAQVLERNARRKPAQQRWLWILTDGRSGDRPARPRHADEVVFVDFEREAIRLGRCRALADAWGAALLTPDELIV